MTRVFLLAGQSNMEGQAVADLDGRDYNDGKGTLRSLLADAKAARRYSRLARPRRDVRVWYRPENAAAKAGTLDFGFTPYGERHHFGPELAFGNVVGSSLLVKCAWGGKSLYRDFRPPTSGGEGPYYRRMIDDVKSALQSERRPCQIAGFVWWHGWNDGIDPRRAIPEYADNLVHLVEDVRRELDAPHTPAVIGEMTGPWIDAPPEWEALRRAQREAAARLDHAVFVPTRTFVRKPEDSPNPTHGHHEFGNAETYLLVGEALGKGMKRLL